MIKLALVSCLVIPWLTLFFMENYKRYVPVAIFTSLIMTIVFEIAYTYKWWIIHEHILPWGYITDVSFAYGLFAVGTIWIFYLTFHKFWIYVLTNLSFDILMAYVGLNILQILGVATIKNITEWQYFLVMFFVSFIIYGYQLWHEKIFVQNT